MRVTHVTTSVLIGFAGALGCADSTSPAAGRPISVSFATSAATGASFSRSVDPGAARDVSVAAGTDALVITKAQLVIARIELQRVGATCASDAVTGDDNDANEDDCAELQLAPSIVDLPVSGNVVNALSVSVPEGTYSALEAKLRPVRSGSDRGLGSSTFLTAHPDLDGVSVLVQGTFNGNPFTYAGAVSTGVERNFSPPLAVTTDPLNLTVDVDLATWFRSSTGALIDPRSANAGGANADRVADNIKRSFHAFRDDDHNGHDDDGEGHH